MLFTNNSKTVISLDFDRSTCDQQCAYCYVINLERIYPAYREKLKTNEFISRDDWKSFASNVNAEYLKLRNSKSKQYTRLHKLPVRIYGSGDYQPHHFKIFEQFDFKFYIISKNLTAIKYEKELKKLLSLQNLTSIVLSFDSDNLDERFKRLQRLRKNDKIKFAFTGLPDEFTELKSKSNLKFDIFFNTSKTNDNKQKTRDHREQCPCTSGLIPTKEACTICSKCWRSSVSREKVQTS